MSDLITQGLGGNTIITMGLGAQFQQQRYRHRPGRGTGH
jgi:hypothetical protein